MKILRLKKIPERAYGSTQELFFPDIQDLQDRGVNLIAYWYAAEEYEGSGHLFGRKGGDWFYANLGHCSCFGPLEHLNLNDCEDSFEKLYNRLSGELKSEVAELVAFLVESGETSGENEQEKR